MPPLRRTGDGEPTCVADASGPEALRTRERHVDECPRLAAWQDRREGPTRSIPVKRTTVEGRVELIRGDGIAFGILRNHTVEGH